MTLHVEVEEAIAGGRAGELDLRMLQPGLEPNPLLPELPGRLLCLALSVCFIILL